MSQKKPPGNSPGISRRIPRHPLPLHPKKASVPSELVGITQDNTGGSQIRRGVPGVIPKSDHRAFFRQFFEGKAEDSKNETRLDRLKEVQRSVQADLCQFEPFITSANFTQLSRKCCPDGEHKFYLHMIMSGCGRCHYIAALFKQLFDPDGSIGDAEMIQKQITISQDYHCASIFCQRGETEKGKEKIVAFGSCVYKMKQDAVQIAWLGRNDKEMRLNSDHWGKYSDDTKHPDDCPKLYETGMSKLLLKLACVHGMLSIGMNHIPPLLLQVNANESDTIKVYERLGFECNEFSKLKDDSSLPGAKEKKAKWETVFEWHTDSKNSTFKLMTNGGKDPIESPYPEYRWFLDNHPHFGSPIQANLYLNAYQCGKFECCAGEQCWFYRNDKAIPTEIVIPKSISCMYCNGRCHLQCLIELTAEDQNVFKFVRFHRISGQHLGV